MRCVTTTRFAQPAAVAQFVPCIQSCIVQQSVVRFLITRVEYDQRLGNQITDQQRLSWRVIAADGERSLQREAAGKHRQLPEKLALCLGQ